MNVSVAVGLVAAAYVIGSIPFGILVARALGAVDPRTAGSRNIGFTNVLRLSGKAAGGLTLAGDLGKGWLVGWAAPLVTEDERLVLTLALVVVLGHVYSVFLRFRGGKGVATALGVLLAIAPAVALGVMAIWTAALIGFRYASAAGVMGFAALPVVGVAAGAGRPFLVFSGLLAAVIVYRHKDNLVRLWHGTEPRVGEKS